MRYSIAISRNVDRSARRFRTTRLRNSRCSPHLILRHWLFGVCSAAFFVCRRSTPTRGPTLRLWCRLSRTAVSGGAQLGPSERCERASSFRRRSCVEGRLANDALPLSPRRSLGSVASRYGATQRRQGRNQPCQPRTWRQRRPARQLRFNAFRPDGYVAHVRTVDDAGGIEFAA